jgi:hypothetical protein
MELRGSAHSSRLVPETIFSELANLLNGRQKLCNPLRFNRFSSCGRLI